MLTIPVWLNKQAAHPVDHNWTGLVQIQISTGLTQLRISTYWSNKCVAHTVDPTWLAQVRISTNCFFSKSPRIPAHWFQAWHHPHPQSHFPSGVFIMTSVIVTSSVHKHEHLHSMCALARALSRIVLSLTKPNDKI